MGLNKRTSRADRRLPGTLLEAEKDAGADSCSNSGTKEKHSQLALDDGNPLTVQPESIREAAGYVWRQARGGGGWFESQGRTVINGGARRIVSFLCSCSLSRALTSVCASLSLSSKKLIK